MTGRLLLVALLWGLLATGTVAQVPSTLHYQASLLEDEQSVEGDVAVTARIFDVESGGQALWAEARPAVPVADGRLSLLLGAETPLPGTLFDEEVRFLEIEINGERLPRLRMASTAYALRAGVASAVVAGAVDAAALAPDAAVVSVNDVPGALTLQGANGTTVNVDPATGVITISAPGGDGGGSGVLGLQNTDGTLQVVDPNGPTATINLQPGGIGPAQIADGGVQTAELGDGAVTARKVADQTITAAKLAPGAVVTAVTAGTGLTGSGTSGAVTLGIDAGGVTAAQLAENAVTRQALAPGVAVDGLNGLTGPVTLAATRGASLTVADDTITISAEGSGGTITGVAAGTGLAGGGTTGAVTLGVAEEGIGAAQLASGAVTGPKIAPNAVTSAMIVDGTVKNQDLAPDAAVNSLNELQGDLRFEADGGASVTVDQGTGVITFSAPEADGTGILGLQNTDGTILIQDPNGPTATINLQAGGIGADQLADEGVTAAKLAERAVQAPALDATNFPNTGQVLSFAGDGEFAWVNTASGDITGVTAGGGLTGGGTTGTVQLSVAPEGIVESSLATGAVSSRVIANGTVARADLAGGTAVTSLGAGTDVLSGDVALQGSPDISVSRVSGENAFRIDFTGSAGGLTSITSNSSLTGDGTSGSPLGVADNAITAARLAANAVASASVQDNSLTAADLGANSVGTSELNTTDAPSDGEVLSYNGTALAWTSAASGDITSVTGTGGLTGNATSGDATLSIAEGGITEPRLAATNTAGTGQVLSYSGSGQFEWADAASGGLLSVTSNSTLTGDGTSSSPLGLNTNAVGSANVIDGSLSAADLGTGSVGTSELIDESVSAADLGDGSVGVSEINTASGPSTDQMLAYDGTGLTWTSAASGDITGVTTGGGLTGGGTTGTVTVSIADEGVTEPRLDATNSAGTGQVLSYSGSGRFEWVDPSASVTTDGTTLTGDGTTTPLAIQDEGVGSTQLAANAVQTTALNDGAVTSAKLASGAVGSAAIGTEAVGTDELADGGITAADLNASGDEIDGYVLTYDDGGNFLWEAPGTITSSLRFKSDVETIADAAAVVERLRGVRFRWTADGRADVGLIAEEVAQVLPELVTYEADGTTVRGLRYAPLVAVLIEAAKGQQAALDAAAETVVAQRVELDALTDRLARLEGLVQSMQAAPTDTP